jgi:hypothetical protein
MTSGGSVPSTASRRPSRTAWSPTRTGRRFVASFKEPVVVEDVFSSDLLRDRAAAYVDEGIRSILSVPLGGEGPTTAALVLVLPLAAPLHRRRSRNLTRAGEHGGRGADHRRTVRRATAYEEQSALLAQASAALADSLDFETTLNTVARLAVPGIGDSCAIHLIDEDDRIRLVAAVHVDPLKAQAMQTLADPSERHDARSWIRTIRDGTPTLLAEIDEASSRGLFRAMPNSCARSTRCGSPAKSRCRWSPAATIGGITFTLGPGERRTTRPMSARRGSRPARGHRRRQTRASTARPRKAKWRRRSGKAARASSPMWARRSRARSITRRRSRPWRISPCPMSRTGARSTSWTTPGALQRLAVAHIDPAKLHLAERLQAKYPEPRDAMAGCGR